MANETNKGPSEIEKIIDVLTDDYGIDIQVLANSIGIESDMLEHFEKRKDSIPPEKMQQLIGLLGSLSRLPTIDPDDRTRSVLNVLVNVHHIPMDSIACFSKVTYEELIRFIYNDKVSVETKYKIASAATMLHFLFRPAN